ncbi:uncharacterized protein M421DRAFT_88791 [Didymella exigua CBS 183.55]|uniref:Mid2 domain-containing protein n=1 Tax=Didymella exigua CBS 183.55 TaxID=1150837 RepID=A0A6A5RYZ1_9PLEO|nr:uncharacterized protein M421DRAFT_88791 [Didymella exigua CBS 183.55]KAF1933621.1 hypothetical protein M421DRAFT_88791 [Didymella exigua CBS 183.55]
MSILRGSIHDPDSRGFIGSMQLFRFSGLVTAACLWSAVAASNSTCYFPNGKENNGGACSPNTEVSACCGPTFVCLSNGLCKPGPDSKKTYAYSFYRSGCTDASFHSTSCPQFCTDTPNHTDRGQGVKSCGNDTYCCGASGDCCTDTLNVFSLNAAEVVNTISASSAYITDTANATSSGDLLSGENNHAMAIGLGVGIGVGGFLLICLAVLYLLKRRRKDGENAGYEIKEEKPSELDAPWRAQLPDSVPASAPTIKAGHTASGTGVIHEIADRGTESAPPPQELEAHTYDWEPRNEPEPRDGGFRPEDSEHRSQQ